MARQAYFFRKPQSNVLRLFWKKKSRFKHFT